MKIFSHSDYYIAYGTETLHSIVEKMRLFALGLSPMTSRIIYNCFLIIFPRKSFRGSLSDRHILFNPLPHRLSLQF